MLDQNAQQLNHAKYRVIFLTGHPLKMSLDCPPHFEKVLSMAAERGEIPNTLTFLIPRGASQGLKHFFEISHLLANTYQIQGRPS